MAKLLLIGTKHSIFTEPLKKAFSAEGLDVQYFDYRGSAILMPYNPIHRVVTGFPLFLSRPLTYYAQRRLDAELLDIVTDIKPDYVFVSKAKDIGLDTLDKISAVSRTANWYPETFDHLEAVKKIAPHYRYFFNFDPELVALLNRTAGSNVYYLPFCADLPKDAKCPELSGRKYNVTFIGSFHPQRYKDRETLLATVKDLGLNIWGNNAWRSTGLKDYYRGHPSYDDMIEIYRQSNVVINYYLTGVDGSGMNVRPFEITSAGALLINHAERRDIFNLFRQHEEFIPFNTLDEVRGIVKKYLADENSRVRIARAGFERTRRDHTYEDRVREIMRIVGKM